MPISPKRHEAHKLDVSIACEQAVCRFVQQHTGIAIQGHQLKKLHQTLNGACQHFSYSSPDAYLRALQASKAQSPEFEYLIAGITVGESYFFRDESQMSFLREVYFPQLIQQRRDAGNLALRIWSAGCSSGQELYSLAIMLHEMLPDIGRWKLHLLGTDINTEVLTRAMRARYSSWSLRATNKRQEQRYFRQVEHDYDLVDHIRDRAIFSYLNLMDDSYPSVLNGTHALDLILCRNVFIYLQRPEIDKVVAKMRDCLQHSGVLVLGATDSFSLSIPELTLHHQGYAYYYRRAEAATDLKPLPDLAHSRYIDIAQHEEPIPASVITAKQQMAASPPDIEAVIELIRQSQWQAIIDATTMAAVSENGLLLQFRAKALANLSRLEEAGECCRRAMAIDATDKHGYYIYGLVLQELEQIADAERAFRQALYLDRFFVEAHYQLGMLMIRTGRMKAGIRALENALYEAEQGDPERCIHDAVGINYAGFAEILKNEIKMFNELLSANAS